jgi:Uncharacterised nucleotidyltransferase
MIKVTNSPSLDSPCTRAAVAARLPKFANALLAGLQISCPDYDGFAELGEGAWEELLGFCDRSQITLLLGHLCRPVLPAWVRTRTDRDWRGNSIRFERWKTSAIEISAALAGQSIPSVLLKGFTHAPKFSPDPLLRAQGDIDIWCQPHDVAAANRVLEQIGYRPVGKSKRRHLAPMIREDSWEWRGDYFAEDLPIPVDLHYQLWDREMEFIEGPSEIDIWRRRTQLFSGAHTVSVLHEADTLTFAALHLLMHLLHGDLRLNRAWEIAYFVHTHAERDGFWRRWMPICPPGVRELALIIFALVSRWFAARFPAALTDDLAALPQDIKLWMDLYGWSPVEALFRPNKDELWLNLCLVKSLRAKAVVLGRRLFPLESAGLTRPRSSQSRSEGAARLLAQRAMHHTLTFFPTCARGWRWWRQLRAQRYSGVFLSPARE